MTAYRVSARARLPVDAVSRRAAWAFAIAAGGALITAAVAAFRSNTATWMAGSYAGDAVVIGALVAIGMLTGGVGGFRRVAVIAAVGCVLSAATDYLLLRYSSDALQVAPVLYACGERTAELSAANPRLWAALGIVLVRALAWIATCAVPYVALRRLTRPRWSAAIAASLGSLALTFEVASARHSWRISPLDAIGYHHTRSFQLCAAEVALAFAFLAAAMALRRAPTAEEAAQSSSLLQADRNPDAVTHDALVAGPLVVAVTVAVSCVTAFAAQFVVVVDSTLLTGSWVGAVATTALVISLERLRRASRPNGSIVPTIAAGTCAALSAFSAASLTPWRAACLRDAAALTLSVALLGLAFGVPRRLAGTDPTRRWLVVVLAMMALGMGVGSVVGLTSSMPHAYRRADHALFIGVFEGTALALAAIASRRVATLEYRARVRIALRKREDDERHGTGPLVGEG